MASSDWWLEAKDFQNHQKLKIDEVDESYL